MGLEERLAQLSTSVSDRGCRVSIKFNRLERQFDEYNRMLILHSDVDYQAENFQWHSVLPTVKIPYRDPALGFLVNGVIFSSVGVYSRAPGVVPDVKKRTLKARTVLEPKVDIVTARNSTIFIGYKRNAVQIVFKRGIKEPAVPIGIFLKAFSGLPYAAILQNFAYVPQALQNAFPCSIPKGSEDLSRMSTYGVESDEEPSIEECVDMVYSAITQIRDKSKAPNYATSWKTNRIASYFDSLHFKTRQKYEATLSVGNRAVGTYLDEAICVPYFKRSVEVTERYNAQGQLVKSEKVKETIEEFKLPAGHYITDDDAREIRRFDIDTLRVRTTRSFILQEATPMLFRAKGYKLVEDLPEISAKAGDIIDEELLGKINATSIRYLEVYTPAGRKVLHRSGEDVELGDFYSILNYLFTHVYMQQTDTTQYEVSNRIILDYEKQIMMEVEQTYNDIASAVIGATELKNLLDSFPSLPSSRLVGYLRDSKHKEISQSDITNVMSRAISETKASALIPETPAAMMSVQKGQYGRLDSFHAPDSDKVGSVQQMTILARLDEDTGEILAPYEKIVNGSPTGQIEYITAAKENNKYIVAWDCKLDTPIVLARCNGDVTPIPRERVDYRDPSPFCDMSVSRMCIPFPGFSQPKRALMATKMNGQAVPILFPERPLVSTGADTEVPSLYYTGRQVLEISDIPVGNGGILELVGHEWKKNLVVYKFIYNNRVFTFSLPFTATDKESLYNYNLNLKGNYSYELDDIIFYNQCCDIRDYDFWAKVEQGALPLIKDYRRPAMALGVNLRVCIKTYGSSTVDDALVISDRLVTDNTLSSIQIFKYSYKLKQNESFSDTDWSLPLYEHVYEKQPLIKISRTSTSRGSSEREILCKQEGDIVYCEKDDSDGSVEVWVATLHHAEVGDKTAGRYGDKSVIAKIVPESEMPYDPEDGVPMDVVSSPLSMPSRMNYGRILEIALGAVMLNQSEQGRRKLAVCTPFYPNIKKDITELYAQEGLTPKRLFNPVYGKLTERPVMTGVLYIMKLEQMSNLKTSAVGYPTAVDPVFGQPVDSINQDKGQAVGEMESWAMIAAGMHHTLNTFYTMYADNEAARRSYFACLAGSGDNENDPWDESDEPSALYKGVNKNALVTQVVMRMFGCDLDVTGNKYTLTPLDMRDIEIEVSRESFTNNYEQVNNSEPVKDFEWFKVPLAAPVINPFWINNFPLHLVLGVKSVTVLASQKSYLDLNRINSRDDCIVPASGLSDDDKVAMLTGIEAVIELVKNTTVQSALEMLYAKYGNNTSSVSQSTGDLAEIDGQSSTDDGDAEKSSTEVLTPDSVFSVDEEGNENPEDWTFLGDLADVPMNVRDVIRFLEQMRRHGQELSMLIWYDMPIMPRMFRQDNVVGDRKHEHSFQQQLKAICSGRSTSQSIYEGLRMLIGYGTAKQDDLVSIRGYFFGRNSQAGQHGKVRGAVLSKRVAFSGRVVITPMEDPSISPFFVGLPWRVVCVELGKILGIRLKKRDAELARDISQNTSLEYTAVAALEEREWQAVVESLGDFNPYLLQQYFVTASESDLYYIFHYVRSHVKKIVEGNVRRDGMVYYKGQWVDPATLPDDATIDCAVVMSGRQPTLHKKSIRSYFVLLVEGYCMRIHPIVCKGYNADFDGDQMYHIQLLGRDKIEACRTISVMQDLISEKDGSYTLDLSQDVALGLYCATTFKDNAATFEGNPGEFHFFDNLEELRTQLEYGDLHYYEAVVFLDRRTNSYYCSTAGRVLVNGQLIGAMTQLPCSDKHGIIAKVLGPEMVSQFKELKYDMVWTTTDIRPNGRPDAVKVASLLLDVYNAEGARESILAAQALYEIGLIASDVYSVSITLDDMSSTVDKTEYMEEPRKKVAQLNNLYQLGLITEESRKLATAHAWDSAKKLAQADIISALASASNTYYMMYSGARGKPDQVMQSVGFIGNISKTTQTDIEYPILRGYGEGLSSLDLFQTCYTARIGVISTQAGTKDTGYATRQSVYMTSGLTIKEDDCGIGWNVMDVEFSSDSLKVRYPDGSLKGLEALEGEFVVDDTEGFELMHSALNRSGYMINEQIIDIIRQNNISTVTLLGRNSQTVVSIVRTLDEEWSDAMLADGYSYALPYTDSMKITKKTIDWIETSGLKQIIAFDEDTAKTGECFDREAYMPVDYDTSQYEAFLDGEVLGSEALYTLPVREDSPGLHYYKNLLTSTNRLTEKAIKYLTKKQIRKVLFANGSVAEFKYKISDLFRDVVEGRVSVGLLHLDVDGCITKATLKYIEEMQLSHIPVRTGLTCLSTGGICAKCYGKSLSSKRFMREGDNLGIASSQAMCEPLSQASLNVGHSGGKRSAGTSLVSGLSYYTRMLQGSMTTERNASLKERFSEYAGYVSQNPHNRTFIKIVDKDGSAHTMILDDPDRLNVPDGAYVDVGDTIVSGLPDLKRYNSIDVFTAALSTRYMLMQEYNKIFGALHVSARNTEVLARAQTSICYLVGGSAQSKTKDTGLEAQEATGDYMLMVSSQPQVVMWYTGIAAYGFENVANMLLMSLLTPEGLSLNSCLGNLITGTTVGSQKATFIPKRGSIDKTRYHKSSVQMHREALKDKERSGETEIRIALGSGEASAWYALEAEDEIFSALLKADQALDALPEGHSEEPELVPAASGEEPLFEMDFVGEEEEEPVTSFADVPEVFDVEFEEVVEAEDEEGSTENDPTKTGHEEVKRMHLD